jgi:hypothetical protein
MFGEYTIWYVLLNFIIMVLGIVAHFAKKKIKGETIADIKSYFKTHFKETVVTCIAGIVGFGSLVASGGLGWVASFLLGYTADSIFNKSAK